MSDKLPTDMVQSFSENNGKTAVFIIEAEKAFPNPPFKGQEQKALRGNLTLFTKIFNGTFKVTPDYIQLDNSATLHKPKFDLGFEIELDFILTITLKQGSWHMNYFDKSTKNAIDLTFHGFMYNG
jgi:hypothetical protein